VECISEFGISIEVPKRAASFEVAHLSEIAGVGNHLSLLGLHETGDERFEVSEDP
jgi:hypothetical protein